MLTGHRHGATIALPSNEVHLWLARYDEIEDDRLHVRYRELMSDSERNQEGRFYFARDRRRYLVTRALVRTVLSRYADIAPAEWTFVTNAYGRPEIANPEALSARLSFNISHTHSLIVLGVTQERALGVDVENVCTRPAPVEIAERFFAPAEVAALAALAPHQRQYRFYEYWTFKESYIKARGMGLSIPLDKFDFKFPNDYAVEIATHADLADDPTRWQFWQLSTSSEYLVAVCAEKSDPAPIRLIVRRLVPLGCEETLAPMFLRTSQ
jgi:4'-phosphopantetheinyl transferase